MKRMDKMIADYKASWRDRACQSCSARAPFRNLATAANGAGGAAEPDCGPEHPGPGGPLPEDAAGEGAPQQGSTHGRRVAGKS